MCSCSPTQEVECDMPPLPHCLERRSQGPSDSPLKNRVWTGKNDNSTVEEPGRPCADQSIRLTSPVMSHVGATHLWYGVMSRELDLCDVFFPQPHNPSRIMRNTPDKSTFRNILQNTWRVLLHQGHEKERPRNCYRPEETQEIWWLSAHEILDSVLEEKKENLLRSK